MKHFLTIILLCLAMSLYAQGTIEAEKVTADSLIGDGSRITGLGNQNLAVSVSGDTLHITEGNYVIIPGISDSNSGNTFANAGPDIINACETSFNLQASQLQPGTTGEWSIVSGTGGVIINEMLPQALFAGQEGESYLLQWTVQMGGGATSFDQLNISIATNTQTSVANAGSDLFAIMNQSVVLNGNLPDDESRWEILDGTGGILSDQNDPNATFTGVPGESYTLRWIHYNECSTSTDEVTLTFSESAAGVPSANGRYFIPDPKFRQYLQIAYPAVMDGDSLIVSMGDEVDKIKITNLDILNLDGIQYLTAFTLFEALSNFSLRVIPYLSDSLKVLKCQAPLEIVPEFPGNLDTIYANDWELQALPAFPPVLRDLSLNSMHHLYTITVFPTSIRSLILSNIPLLAEIPEVPDSCQFVRFSNISGGFYYDEVIGDYLQVEYDGVLNIPRMANEFHANGIHGLDSFPTLPNDLSNLELYHLSHTNVSQMPSLYGFQNLKYIDIPDNQLLVIDSLPFALQNISLQQNPIICVKNKPPLVASQMSQYEICPHE